MRPDIKDRCAHMRKIPKAAIDWMKSKVELNRILYRKKGRKATCFCTTCGYMWEDNYKPASDSFESQFESLIEEPEWNGPSICPKCSAKGLYKPMGRYKGEHETSHAIIGQRQDGTDFVWRIFKIVRYVPAWNDLLPATSRVETYEYSRFFLTAGKKAQKDYYLHSFYTGTNEWYPHNIGGIANIPFPYEAEIWPGSKKEIRSTPMFKYIPDPNPREYGEVSYWCTAARYNQDFEMMAKLGLKGVIKGLMYGTLKYYNQRGKTPWDRLRINKEHFKGLNPDTCVRDIEIYQLERLTGKSWTEDEVKIIRNLNTKLNEKTVKTTLRYARPEKILKYIESHCIDKSLGYKRTNYVEYQDYIKMRADAGYDLSNEIYLFPKDLHRRHNEMVLVTQSAATNKRIKEVEEKYTNIPKEYNKLMDKYGASAGGYIIRPAKSAGEIVLEGKILHHCVGGDYYLSKHNKGTSFILFLRPVKKKDIPYITVEIEDTHINQWYGAYDQKPEAAKMQAWLDTYIKELKKREKPKKKRQKTQKVAI